MKKILLSILAVMGLSQMARATDSFEKQGALNPYDAYDQRRAVAPAQSQDAQAEQTYQASLQDGTESASPRKKPLVRKPEPQYLSKEEREAIQEQKHAEAERRRIESGIASGRRSGPETALSPRPPAGAAPARRTSIRKTSSTPASGQHSPEENLLSFFPNRNLGKTYQILPRITSAPLQEETATLQVPTDSTDPISPASDSTLSPAQPTPIVTVTSTEDSTALLSPPATEHLMAMSPPPLTAKAPTEVPKLPRRNLWRTERPNTALTRLSTLEVEEGLPSEENDDLLTLLHSTNNNADDLTPPPPINKFTNFSQFGLLVMLQENTEELARRRTNPTQDNAQIVIDDSGFPLPVPPSSDELEAISREILEELFKRLAPE